MKEPERPAASPVVIGGGGAAARGGRPGVVFSLLFAAIFCAYLPCLQGDFLWDDAGHVTSPALQSWSGLVRIWFEPGTTQQYYPLLHSAFWIEHRIWGDATLGYHLINVMWHATSACLFIAILRRLAIPGALLAGFLFALHPVAVESVAWISEQKNTLSTLFSLAAALAWLRFEDDRRASHYVFATLWFLAALLTKSVTATLPGALLVLAWWRRGRLSWRQDVAPLLPWLVLSLVAGLGTSWFERTQIGATGGDFTLNLTERGLLAGRVGWFYLGKLLWPAGLSFFYPRWSIDASSWWQWLFPIATLAALAMAGWWSRRDRSPLAAALIFGGTLFPVLGFVNVYPFVFSYVADHFQYLASLAVFAFFAALATRWVAGRGWPRSRGAALASALLLILGILTWRQSAMYRDVFSLYEGTLARNPSSWAAQLNLGTALDDAGRTAEALPHLQRALELKPDFPETLNSLGNVLNRLRRPAEARPLLERAVQIQPRYATAFNTLGTVLMALGQPDAGIAAFRRSVEIDPQLALARVNLGWALGNNGRLDEALFQFEEARRLQPESAEAEFKWGLTFAMHGRAADAVQHFAQAVQLRPDNADMRHALGRVLMEIGQPAEAGVQFEEALQIDPNHAGARDGLDRLNQVPRQ